jgi:hypothetical protein
MSYLWIVGEPSGESHSFTPEGALWQSSAARGPRAQDRLPCVGQPHHDHPLPQEVSGTHTPLQATGRAIHDLTADGGKNLP